MTKDPVFRQTSDTALVAAKLMRRHNIGVLPVVGNLHARKLVGIVADRRSGDENCRRGSRFKYGYLGSDHAVLVVPYSPDDRYEKPRDLMERHQIKRVVDKLGRVIGLISQTDVALRVATCGRLQNLPRASLTRVSF